jgi:aminoglycoside phosphotransferase (APT) family kinase protein
VVTTAALAVPDGIEDLTAEWLSAALGRVVDHVRASPIGTGQTGSSHRLALQWADGSESTLVAKTGAEDAEVRQRVAYAYRAELAFYRDIAVTVRIPVPRVHAVAATDDCSQFVLLMDDLAPAVQGDQLAGTGADVVVAGARALAGLHGPRWCDPTWHDVDEVVMPAADEQSAAGLAELGASAATTVLDTLGDRLTPRAREVLAAFPARVPDLLLSVPERFALLHGDYRLDNLMLHPDGGVTVVDWQTLSIGLPARDLAYWVTTSVPPEKRQQVEDAALSAYLGALGVPGYERDQLWDDYRLGQLHTPLLTCLGWAFSTQTERGGEMVVAVLERAAAALVDLEVL